MKIVVRYVETGYEVEFDNGNTFLITYSALDKIEFGTLYEVSAAVELAVMMNEAVTR